MAVRYTVGAHRQLKAQGCTISVYDAGGSSLSTIYANEQGDALSNPFVWAGAEATPTFYAPVGDYYVTIENTALPTNQKYEVSDEVGEELLANGTAAGPSIAFASDNDTGLYRAAANSLGVAVGGANTVSLTENGLDFSGHTVGTGTAGTLMTTGTTWLTHATAGQCALKLLCANSAATGDYATVRMRARADAAGSTVCGNFAASGGANNHGSLYAVQGYAQPNAYTNTGTPYTVGLYSCIDRTTGGSSAGFDWSTWIDTHMQVKATGSSYLCRLSHNGTVANDGCFTVYHGGRMPVLFNFEDATAGGFLTDAGDAGSTKAGYLAVKTPAGTKYIQLVTA